MKRQEVEDVLKLEYGIEFEYDCSKKAFKGRWLRFVGQNLQISDLNFDRWANSLYFEFDYSRMKYKGLINEIYGIWKIKEPQKK